MNGIYVHSSGEGCRLVYTVEELAKYVRAHKVIEGDCKPVYKREGDDASLSLDVVLHELAPDLTQQERLDFALENGLVKLSEVNATSAAKLP